MRSIYYWWYAEKRLAALNIDIIKDDGENYVFLAQRDMIELEIEWYKEETKTFLMILIPILIMIGGAGYEYYDYIYTFVSDISMKVYEFFFNYEE